VDRDGKLIAPALVPSPPAHGPTEGERVARCVACRAYHGSVNAARICLENEVIRQRAVLRARGIE
jgi:hypothetical protein